MQPSTSVKQLSMQGPVLLLLILSLIIAAGTLLTNGCGGGSASSSGSSAPPQIQHIVVIFQENRTPDNLFHDPVLINRGADIASSGLNSKGQTISLKPIVLGSTYFLSNSHQDFVNMCDLDQKTNQCRMDGADKIPVSSCTPSCPPNPQFMYVNPADVQPYFTLAEQYTFGDRMFQTNQGPSFPAHQFIISGTSAPTSGSKLFASENPIIALQAGTGCVAPATQRVPLIDPAGQSAGSQYPCFDHPTLADLLDAKGISWHYYIPSIGLAESIWSGPVAIQHLCQPKTQNGVLVCTGADWQNVILRQAQVLTDVASGQLPQVSWVIPDGKQSDHAGADDASGPSWVASIVNAIGNSSYWSNTAIIITWDDWGGWYDHVAPKVVNNGSSWGSGYAYGFRVPLIVVSAYAKPGYISHTTHDFGSIVKFVEKTFSLPSLGYADAAADDLSDCFSFTQSPNKFQTISAPVGAEQFINDARPPTPPDDD
jgi:phospholipase C